MWEAPPPTQGVAALMALNLLEAAAPALAGAPLQGGDWLHAAVESARLAFADALAYNAGTSAAGLNPGSKAGAGPARLCSGACLQLAPALKMPPPTGPAPTAPSSEPTIQPWAETPCPGWANGQQP